MLGLQISGFHQLTRTIHSPRITFISPNPYLVLFFLTFLVCLLLKRSLLYSQPSLCSSFPPSHLLLYYLIWLHHPFFLSPPFFDSHTLGSVRISDRFILYEFWGIYLTFTIRFTHLQKGSLIDVNTLLLILMACKEPGLWKIKSNTVP